MLIRDTSLMALEEVQKRLEPDQWAIYEILAEIGPAHDRRILEALNQKEKASLKSRQFKRIWEINQVTARRNELVKLQLIRDIGTYSGNWNSEKKTYHFWRVAGDKGEPAGWIKTDIKIHRPRTPEQVRQQRENFEQIRERAEEPILEKLAASKPNRTLFKMSI